MIIALDSNVLAYFAQVSRVPADEHKIGVVQSLLRRLAIEHRLIAPAQAFGELYSVFLKSGSPREEAFERTKAIAMRLEAPSTDRLGLLDALSLATRHNLQVWDAVIIETSRRAGATILLSEDMQHGFAFRGLTIVDPFAQDAEDRLFG